MDSLLFSSINGSALSDSSSRRHEIPSSEMVLLGRCREFLALSTGKQHGQHQHEKVEMNTPDNKDDEEFNNSANKVDPSCYRFVCIRYLVTSDNNRYDSQDVDSDAPSVPLTHIVTTRGSGEDISFSEQTGMSKLRAALTHMKQRGVEAVLCSDKVESEAVFEAVSQGIYLVGEYFFHLFLSINLSSYVMMSRWIVFLRSISRISASAVDVATTSTPPSGLTTVNRRERHFLLHMRVSCSVVLSAFRG
jgi:hypothetical protein